jgi:hypothetical protein
MIRGVLISLAEGVIRRFSADGRVPGEFEDRELLQHFGFASRPPAGADLIIIREGNHFVCVADGHRKYTFELKDGEAALFDSRGQSVHLSQDGIMVTTDKKIEAEAPEINLGGDRDGLLRLIDERILELLNAHTHQGVMPGPGTTGAMTVPITAEQVCTDVTRAK